MPPDRQGRRDRQRRVHVLLIGAAVCGLHAVAILMLLARPIRIAGLRETPAMEITSLPQTRMRPTGVPQAPSRDAAGTVTGSARAGPRGRSSAATVPAIAAPPGQTPPAVDWAREIETETARTAVSQTPAFKEFGLPRSGAPAAAQAPEFGWEYARTHRVEVLPEGGVVINLSDRCVLVLAPFPFPFCGIGTKPANGNLFKNMNRPRN